MSYYQNIKRVLSNKYSTESDDKDKDLKMDSEPSNKVVGEVPIELPIGEDVDTVKDLVQAFTNKGYTTSLTSRGISLEGSTHHGMSMILDSNANNHDEPNLVVNGVYLPDELSLNDEPMVRVIGPMDLMPDSKNGVLYLLEDDPEMIEHLSSEGYKVTCDVDECVRMWKE